MAKEPTTLEEAMKQDVLAGRLAEGLNPGDAERWRAEAEAEAEQRQRDLENKVDSAIERMKAEGNW